MATWVTYSPDGYRPASYRELFSDGGGGVIQQATPDNPYPVQAYSTVACGTDDFAFVWLQARGKELPFRSYQGRFIPFGDSSPSASFVIGINDAGRAKRPDATHLTDGTMVVVWTDSNESFASTEVFAQRFGFSSDAPTCAADCDGDGTVEINELVSAVAAALQPLRAAELKRCLAADRNLDFRVSVDELIEAVSALLRGCG